MEHGTPSAEPSESLKTAALALSHLHGYPILVFAAYPICGHPDHFLSPLRSTLESLPGGKVGIVIESGGGDPKGAYLFVRELRRQFTEVTAFVPYWAKSAATLICLGANELVLGELGELGPLDVQVEERQRGDFPRYRSTLERFKALEQLQKHSLETFNLVTLTVLEASGMRPLDVCTIAAEFTARICSPMYSQIDPDALGQNARDLEVGLQYATRILNRYRLDIPEEVRANIARALVREYPSHDFPIDLEELAEIGLPARAASKEEAPILDQILAGIREVGTGDFLTLFDATQPTVVAPIAVPGSGAGTGDVDTPSADIRRVK